MQKPNRVFKIFIDFDGTITTVDVGEEMFMKFGDPEKAKNYIKIWEENKSSSREMWPKLFATLKDFDFVKFDQFLESIQLDEAFHLFYDFCKKNEFEMFIVSDGFDYYIKKILSFNGFSDIPVFSNKLMIDENHLEPSFPFSDAECEKCGNCKRNHVINNSGDEEYSFYIGDGMSDTCPVLFCDYVFAKKSLLKYCEKERITYFPFNNFHNIIKKLEELKNKNNLKKRHQAEIRRRDVYLQG